MLEQSEVQSRLHVNFVKYDPKFDLGKPKKKKKSSFHALKKNKNPTKNLYNYIKIQYTIRYFKNKVSLRQGMHFGGQT